ncbi:MAG: formylglycine-generating enzyme family protein [Myxococcaceae bacterium]|nr:formylglycine-generating enzyme family protein [Myxococcaceae bacterium]
MSALALVGMLVVAGAAPSEGMARVGPGRIQPAFQQDRGDGAAGAEIEVPAFLLDRHPVTNAEFLEFVRRHPEWQRGRVSPLFADERYLARWASPLDPGPDAPLRAPVTEVSWFAARAYCKSRGARLPTENEWELAARAGADEPGFTARILAWYAQPTPKVLPEVARGEPNAWGVYDLHGLVWEWVSDFTNALVSGDSRDPGDPDRIQFCGAGALALRDKRDYATFMRVAFRSSLEARYSIANLGFRCARDLP